MTIEAFIEENRAVLLDIIGNSAADDDEIELWISNEEGLYLWAQSEGVDV